MGIQSVWRTIRWSLTQRGLAGTLRSTIAAVRRRRHGVPERVHPFDEQHGTDTGGVIGGGNLATGSRNDAFITAYAGVSPSRLREALRRWQETLEPGRSVEQFHFVDLGCGKGRALLLASELPFREVLGVELNPRLAAVAAANVALWTGAGKGTGSRIDVREGDATELSYPEGPLLVFIYNSFGPPVVRAVLDALERHVRHTGARIDVLFQNEGPEMPLRADVRLRLLWTTQLPLVGEDAEADPVASPEDVTSLYRWAAADRGA